jgi:hypothetical protein
MSQPDAPGGEHIGKVEVDVVPSTRGFARKLKHDLDDDAARAGRDLGRSIAAPVGEQVAAGVLGGIRDGGQRAAKVARPAGRDFGETFGTELNAGIVKALKGLPDIKVGADTSTIDKAAANIRRELLQLTGKRVGVDISSDEALARLQQLRNQTSLLARDIAKLQVKHPEIQIDVDAVKAMAELTALKSTLGELTREQPTVQMQVEDTAARARLAQFGIVLDETGRDRVINIDTDMFAALVKLAGLEDVVTVATADRTMNVDADVFAAIAQMGKLDVLATVATRDRTLNVDADVGRGIAQLLGLSVAAQAAAASEGEAAAAATVLDFSLSGVSLKVSAIIAGVITLAALLIPFLASAIVLAGALAVAVGVIAAGFVVAALALVPIVAAFQAVGKAQSEQSKQAARSAVNTNAVADATRNLGRVHQQVARDIAAADDRIRQAHQGVIAATQDLAKAQQAVNDARAQARRDAEDLSSTLEHNAQDQRQNALDLAEARKNLDAVRANPASTQAQIEAAQLAYDRLTLQNKDLKVQAQRLGEQRKKLDKDGIEGSDRVVAAKEALARSEQALEQRRADYAKAQQARDQAQVDGARRVADAQRAIARAQQQHNVALTQTSAAAQDAASKMGKLTAEARSLVLYLKSLDFSKLTRAAMGFAAPLEQGLRSFIPTMLPVITEFVRNVSAGIGESFKVLFTAFASPFWKQFIGFLGDTAKTALPLFAKGFEYAARAIAGVIQAFGPVAKIVGAGFLDLLQKMADASEHLGQNKAFQDFISYAVAKLPQVGELLGNIADFVINLGVALAPIGDVVLSVANAFFAWLAGLDPDILTAIVGAVLAMSTALAAVAAGAIIAALGEVAAVVAAIGAAVAAVIYLFQSNKTFHDFVVSSWEAISSAISTAWTGYIQPALAALWDWIQNKLAPALVSFWQTVVVPAWAAITTAVVAAWGFLQPIFAEIWRVIRDQLMPIFLLLWHYGVEPAFAAIKLIVTAAWEVLKLVFQAIWWTITNILAPVFLWLWHNIIEPAWTGIKAVITIAWGAVKLIFAAIQIFIEGVLAPLFTWFWHQVIEPVWHGIRDTIAGVWERGIKPILEVVGNFISEHVAPAFRAGVSAISSAWGALIDFLKVPVDFMVNVVINQGIIGGLKWLAEKLGVTDVKIEKIPWPPSGWSSTPTAPSGAAATRRAANLVKGRATGGAVYGPGTGTSDSILARLSAGEHVWTAKEVEAVGGHENILALRRLAMTGTLAQLAGFATGGPVTTDVLPRFAIGGQVKKQWGLIGDALTWVSQGVKGAQGLISDFTKRALSQINDPGAQLRGLSDKLLALMPNKDSLWTKILAGVPNTVIGYLSATLGRVQLAGDVGAGGGGAGGARPWTGTMSPDPLLKRMQEFALAQRGKRYLFGAVGPQHYDCSGLVGDLWAIATGNPLYRRYFSTGDMGSGRFGMQSGPGRFTIYLGKGHTAANIAGLHAEAFHGNGTPLAIGHVGTPLSYYYARLHLPGLAGGGPVRFNSEEERLKSFLSNGWPEPPVSFRFDTGGLLHDTRGLPGHVMPIYHGSTKPDAVLTDQQWRDLHQLATRAESQGRTGVHIDNYWEQGADPHTIARDLDWLSRGLG